MPLRYKQCRALGHSWVHRDRALSDEEDGFRRPIGVEYGSVGLVSECSNCSTVRTKWISRSGAMWPAIYRYPQGYQTHGDDTMQPVEWRSAFVVTVFGEA